MEIVSGLEPTDDVILSPSDSLTSGTPVQISGSKKEGVLKLFDSVPLKTR
jgi:hypothetical protein